MREKNRTKALYDVHAHILPELDDGALNADMTLAMLRTSANRGVTHVVATPHSEAVHTRGGSSLFKERLAAVQSLVAEHNLPLEVLPGMEIHLLPEVPDRLATAEYWPLGNTRYVLAEFDYTQWANYAEDVLFGIALQGYRPLLAHVERIVPLQERPQLVERFVLERGFHAQITAMSLLGGMGPAARKSAEDFLQRGLVHIVASDMHRPSGNRQPMPLGTSARLRELVGDEAADILLYGNPAALLADMPLRTIEPAPAKQRRWWWPFG